MRQLHSWLLIGTFFLAPLPAFAHAGNPADRSLVRIQVVTDAGEMDGAAVLISREDRAGDVVLHFLTSSQLFRDSEGDERRTLAVRAWLDERWVTVGRADVVVPINTLVDVAILRATAAATTLVPRPLLFEAPASGEVFMISGFDRNRNPTAGAQRVRFRSALLAVGDREVATLAGCVGAPAISERGVFGVVSECASGRPPVIALLGPARSFLERHVGHPPIRTSLVPQFVLANREIAGPLLTVACEATRTGELDIPLSLGSQESAIDVSADFVKGHEVRLAEISVLRVLDRSVRLRFSLGGVLSPPEPPRPCPMGQALVSLRVAVAVARPPE